MLGAIFELKQRWASFCQIFSDFTPVFDKSNLLGVRLHPHLLCHLMYCNLNVFYFL